jgi:hypothetical protein
MKCIYNIILCSVFMFLFSCKKEVETPKVIYENPSKVVITPIEDKTKIVVADLPIQMEGTNYFLFPIGELHVSDNNYDSSSRGGNQLNYKVSNYSEYQITGSLRNIKFQQIGKDSIKNLTEMDVVIHSATYLKSIADKTKQQILVYVLEDMDTNKDLALDDNDIKSLYLSDISGNRFIKVSVDYQELIDWKVVESMSRLYFRTIEDTDKNGEFDKKDKLHYHFIDLSGKDWKVSDYNLN